MLKLLDVILCAATEAYKGSKAYAGPATRAFAAEAFKAGVGVVGMASVGALGKTGIGAADKAAVGYDNLVFKAGAKVEDKLVDQFTLDSDLNSTLCLILP